MKRRIAASYASAATSRWRLTEWVMSFVGRGPGSGAQQHSAAPDPGPPAKISRKHDHPLAPPLAVPLQLEPVEARPQVIQRDRPRVEPRLERLVDEHAERL